MFKNHIVRQINKLQQSIILIRKMSELNRKIAVCQMTATNDKIKNFEIVANLIKKAKENNAAMVFLPEGCDYIAKDSNESISLAEEETGPLMTNYCTLAKQENIWISIGGFHEKLNDLDKIYNTHFIINNKGEIKAKYRKLHLFDVVISEEKSLLESKTAFSGSEIIEPIDTPVGKIGLCICYDLRFPEMSTLLRKAGASILTYPSAFTHQTGVLHWETLLRARAIENQCYVIAAAQIGVHNDVRSSYGCAMVVDPLGKILDKCSENDNTDREPEIIFAELVDEKIEQVRKNIPVFNHRRNDVYTLFGNINLGPRENLNNFNFSTKIIPANTIFYQSSYSFAFTNIRCVVPGHVLVATKRIVQRLTHLEDIEIADLFQTVIKVQKIVEENYKCNSSTVVVQDGPEAGQTIPHVHVHILPRKNGDFQNNDDIYDSLARHDRSDTNVSRRSDEEMAKEANMLKSLFSIIYNN